MESLLICLGGLALIGVGVGVSALLTYLFDGERVFLAYGVCIFGAVTALRGLYGFATGNPVDFN